MSFDFSIIKLIVECLSTKEINKWSQFEPIYEKLQKVIDVEKGKFNLKMIAINLVWRYRSVKIKFNMESRRTIRCFYELVTLK